MFAKTGRLALAILLAVPAVLAAQGFSYAPGTGQYRITSEMKGAQEVMGQRQEIESSSSQLVTITVARAARDTLRVTTRLDSISVVGPMGMTPPGLDKLAGVTVVSLVSPTGTVYSSQGPSSDSIPNAEQLTDEMSHVLPRVRPTIAAGASWTDTTTRKVNQGGIEIDRTVIATYRVAGDTAMGGQRAWKITRTATTSMSGSGSQGGQPMTLEGTSEGSGAMFVTQAGLFLGFENLEQAKITVLLAANGMEVGLTQNATTRVEKVK
jgi:hypothetical protein